jgi:hypothetical protein
VVRHRYNPNLKNDRFWSARSLCSIILGHSEGPRVLAVKLGIGGSRLASEQTKATTFQAVIIGGAEAWLGHFQHILGANKCTSMPVEHIWFVKHVQGEGTTCRAQTWHKETQM